LIRETIPLAHVPSSSVKLETHGYVEGPFTARPLACIPNS
jgi:hypothetical protein